MDARRPPAPSVYMPIKCNEDQLLSQVGDSNRVCEVERVFQYGKFRGVPGSEDAGGVGLQVLGLQVRTPLVACEIPRVAHAVNVH